LNSKQSSVSAAKKTLGRDARLRSRDIAVFRSAGEKLYAKHFMLVVVRRLGRTYTAPSPEGGDPQAVLAQPSRLAIAVTTKIDKRATVRNRIKRRVREVFRQYRAHLRTPIDLLVVARRDVQSCTFEQVERELAGALRKAGYL
jgi:ribonuclease P protein component